MRAGLCWLSRLGRLRSEYAERSFARLCETGGTWRLWLRGIENIAKWYLMRVAAWNLGVIMRAMFAIGTPRSMQGLAGRLRSALGCFITAISSLRNTLRATAGADRTASMNRHAPVPLAA